MPTTTGDHPLTYPAEGATNWYATWESFAQAISNHLDDLNNVEIAQIDDSNNNEMITFTTTASAINHFNITNAALGNGPAITAVGDDTNIDISITPKAAGNINLDGLAWPNADGSANQFLQTDGAAALSWATALINIVEDTTPQLGGALDVNGQEITGAIDLHSSGDIICELGDAVGTNKVSIRDSAAVETASINSDGDIAATDISSATITTTGAADVNTLAIASGTAMTAILDEDTMASDSATGLATQQSIKAYVDSQTGGGGESAQAYVLFDASSGTPTITDQLNVDSITDNGTGDFTLNFAASTFDNANYIVAAHARDQFVSLVVIGDSDDSRTTSAYTAGTFQVSGSAVFNDADEVNLVFFGGQT